MYELAVVESSAATSRPHARALVAVDHCCTIGAMEGGTIGPYRVTGVIGQGGMGAVYAAEHALLGRPAAIKVLLPELSQKQDIVMRFFNEARAATAIRHPGIVEIYDFGWTTDGAAFIVMERLDGETLARRAARGRMRWQAALGVARQIAGALAAAHSKAIVHRDLKPDNVFLVLDPEVPGGERIKLLDFGIAKLAGESSSAANATRTGQVMGTPTYMAPEQCRGVAVDHRVDLYALGCVVFELCSGRPPFIGEGTGDVLAAHIHVPPPSLAAMSVEAPYAVEQLVQRLLAKSPRERVQTAEETIRAIDAIANDHAPAMALPSSAVRVVASSPSNTTLSGAAAPPRAPLDRAGGRGGGGDHRRGGRGRNAARRYGGGERIGKRIGKRVAASGLESRRRSGAVDTAAGSRRTGGCRGAGRPGSAAIARAAERGRAAGEHRSRRRQRAPWRARPARGKAARQDAVSRRAAAQRRRAHTGGSTRRLCRQEPGHPPRPCDLRARPAGEAPPRVRPGA